MSFLSRSFEINREKPGNSYVYEETLAEGQQVFFLGAFAPEIEKSETISEAFFATLLEILQESSISDPYDHFESAVKAVNELSEKYPLLKKYPPNITMGFFDFVELYLTQTGENETYLLRGSDISSIAEQADGKDLFKNILSGQVSLNDVLIFTTSGALSAVSPNEMVSFFLHSDFSEAVLAFQMSLAAQKKEKTAVLVVGVGKKEPLPVKKTQLDGLKASGKEFLSGMTQKISGIFQKGATGAELAPKNVSEMNISAQRAEKSAQALPRVSKRSLLMAGGVFGLLLLALGVRSFVLRESEKEAELKMNIETANQALVEADQLLAQGNREEAGIRLQTAHESVDFILRSGEKDYRITAQELLQEIEERKLTSENAEKTPASPLADLGLSLNNVEAQAVVNDGNTNYILDNRNVHRVIRSNVEPGPSISEDATEILISGAISGTSNSLVLLTDTPRIIEYNERTLTPMKTDDETWKKGLDLKAYGRYIYILDPVNNQIWKYERRRSSYGPASAYNLDSKADLSQAISMAIDGAIYVLSADGSVQKLLSGEKQAFSLEEMPSTPLEGAHLRIWTVNGSDFLFILDPNNQRILVLQKSDNKAVYKKQILYDVPNVVDFAINSDETRATLITKERVYEVSL